MQIKQMTQWFLMVFASLVVASFFYRAGAQQAAAKPTASNERYRIIINSNVRADTFLLDTETGKTWVQTVITDLKGEPTVWMYRDHIDNDPAYLEWLRGQTLKAK